MNGNENRFQIRRASTVDAELLSVLGAVTFFEAYFEQDDPRDLAHYIVESFSLETIVEDLKRLDTSFYLALIDRKAVGYAKLLEKVTGDGVSGHTCVELRRIYLVERIWGTGIGESLLNFCIEKAARRGFDTIWLSVWQENHRARRFYEKHGFKTVGKLTFPYGDTVGINDVMEKRIAGQPT